MKAEEAMTISSLVPKPFVMIFYLFWTLLFPGPSLYGVETEEIATRTLPPLVAVVDTGIDYYHPFLTKNIVAMGALHPSPNNYGVDFSYRAHSLKTPWDRHGHGTHVAGIIKSVHPQVRLLALKYYNAEASGVENLRSTIKALRYAVETGVDIINYSGGGPEPSAEELEILKQAEKKGILVVAAAGNEHSDIDQQQNAYYPASYGLSNIITVGAHDELGESLPSSNWGKNSVDISAPGKDIISSVPLSSSGSMTGTSQATAFVTGIASLIKASYPSLSASSIRKIIILSAKKIANYKLKNQAGGILDTKKAIQVAGQFNLGIKEKFALTISK
jgi:thermitase